MKKILTYISLAVVASFFSSCSEEAEPVVNGASFEIQSHDDFLWSKDAVDTVKFTINTDFVECENVNEPLVLALCDQAGKLVEADVATLFVGGKKSEDNKVYIPVENGMKETKVGIVINREYLSDDCTFKWHIKLCSDAGLTKVYGENKDGVRSLVCEDEPWMYGMDIQVKNVHVVNTLEVWTNIIFWILLAALVAWHLLSRIVNPPVKFTRITIDYGDGEIRYDTRGAYKVVLINTQTPYKVGFFHWLFVGKVCVIRNDFWTSEMTIKRAYGQNLRLVTRGEYILPDEAVRREEFEIRNEDGRRATLFTN